MARCCQTPILQHLPILKTKRVNLLSLTAIIILCTAFYLIGLWQNSTPITSSTASVKTPCTTSSPLSKSRILDFMPHHKAQDLIPTAAHAINIPHCDSNYTEYCPCEDTKRSLKYSRDRLVYRERHCPERQELLKCRIPAPYGYKVPFRWPESRDMAWYDNVPHKELAIEKKNQNWIKYEGDRFRFPGGGTMFPKGADAYIDDIGKLINLKDGSIRTAIDTGCGVASWGAYLLSRDIIAVSFAPRDTHEGQVQFALERGVPALIGIMASIRLPYPSRAFDMAHCSRCLIPWGQYDGLYLFEVDRILRPGGYWILSGPPINWEHRWKGWNRTRDDLDAEQSQIEMVARRLCWKKVVQKGDLAIWQKPANHLECRTKQDTLQSPPFCSASDPDLAWYTDMDTCITPLPTVADQDQVAGGQVERWPERLTAIPPRILSGSLKGITADTFRENNDLWNKRVAYYKKVDHQLRKPGRYRNLLDMNAYLGGFAAALVDDPVWVMNVVPVEAEINTLGVIYERGLIGTYQNWCEAMSTYPRTCDFIHADHIFSLYKDRCEMVDILLEMDRILRPEGTLIIRDDVDILTKIETIASAMQWDSRIADHESKGPHEREKILVAKKQYWTAPAPAKIKD